MRRLSLVAVTLLPLASLAEEPVLRYVPAHDELDAYQFVTQGARAPLVQIADPEYTVLVKIEKRRLPRPVAK
jgi:hypothetical protein